MLFFIVQEKEEMCKRFLRSQKTLSKNIAVTICGMLPLFQSKD
ncbi:hypothetical protein HMPREF0541_01960 [Lacticaseibacillus rhamnosus ATCC 21052]|nr:hypothetical protein HMPREF0541_01960 [Lacticaseibacillus rhamnosus ATCC 21052]